MGIFSKLFGAKDNTSAVKEYSSLLISPHLSQIITAKSFQLFVSVQAILGLMLRKTLQDICKEA